MVDAFDVDAGKLVRVLSEFASTLATDFSIRSILDHLVLEIVDILPVTSAGVTLIEPHEDPRYMAASDAAALRFEDLQSTYGEGPCLLAYHSGTAVVVPDLGVPGHHVGHRRLIGGLPPSALWRRSVL